MVIVLVEVFTGAGYYLAHDYQEKTEQPIWATLKFAAILTFIFLENCRNNYVDESFS